MNRLLADDNTYSVEIGIDAEEEALGVIGGRVIRWKRATVYVYELADGTMAAGICVARPHLPYDADIGRALARRNAIRQIARMREPGARA
jgi:hypothetical protein